jgi:hypothetical protein
LVGIERDDDGLAARTCHPLPSPPAPRPNDRA